MYYLLFLLDCKFNCHKRCASKVPKDCLGEVVFNGGTKQLFLVVYQFDALWPLSVLHVICSVCLLSEPASPAPDSDTTMEVDISDVNSDSSRGQDDSEEPSTPEDKIFRDYPFSDQEKDEEPVKAPQIR